MKKLSKSFLCGNIMNDTNKCVMEMRKSEYLCSQTHENPAKRTDISVISALKYREIQHAFSLIVATYRTNFAGCKRNSVSRF